MELKQYIRTVRKHWRIVLGCVLLALIAGVVIVSLSPQVYEAEADLVLLKSGALLNFEPNYKTISDLNSNTDVNARRRALITIGKSPALAAAVIAKLNDKLGSGEQVPTKLLQAIDVSIDGDAVKIKARTSSAEKSMLLANQWAEELRRRVNDIYAETPIPLADIQSQADSAKRDYDDKENALIALLGSSKADQLRTQIALRQQKLLDLSLVENKLDRALTDAASLRAHTS